MATGTIKNELVDTTTWLLAKSKDITIHLNNSSELLVMALSHGFVAVFHCNSAGYVTKSELLNTGSITLDITTANTIAFSASSTIVLNALCLYNTAKIL